MTVTQLLTARLAAVGVGCAAAGDEDRHDTKCIAESPPGPGRLEDIRLVRVRPHRGVLERLLDQRCTPAWKSAAAERRRVLFVPQLDVQRASRMVLTAEPETRECGGCPPVVRPVGGFRV